MKNIKSILSLIAVATFVVPTAEIYADGKTVPASQVAPAKRSVRVEYKLPVLSVNNSGKNGKVRWLDFEFSRKDAAYPLTVFTGNVESGGTGPEIAASVWSAAMVSALMRGDLMTGTRIQVGFPGGIDGPSAGGMFCLAILSALDGREFPEDFVMTGTILPDGSIGLVGGVAEKIKAAAKEKKIKRVCIPALGRVEEDEDWNLTDLTKEAKRHGLELILVETVEEAYAAAHRLPLPKKEVLSEREILFATLEAEEVWSDNFFRDYNRASAIVRRHRENSNVFYSRYYANRLYSGRLFKAGYFQNAAENAFESLLFMRAWDWSDYVFDDFLRSHEDLKRAWEDCVLNRDKSVTDLDRRLLSTALEHFDSALNDSAMRPTPEKDDSDVPKILLEEGIGYFRDAPWITEITAQLEPVLAYEDALGWKEYFDGFLKCEVKTKGDVVSLLDWGLTRATYNRFALARLNEHSYFVETAERIPQIRGNANLMKAQTFYHSAQLAVYTGLTAGCSRDFSLEDHLLYRFLIGHESSNLEFSDAVEGEKKVLDPSYNALARIIADCRLLALGAALQIKYGTDVGAVRGETLWTNSYENTYFLSALIRMARRQALSKIKKCRDKNIPCPAALSAFVEAETSHGDRERDLISDVLMNYWVAGNIAQALDLCFDAQPTTEQAAEQGNADALFRLGVRKFLSGDVENAYEFLRKAALQGDARAQFYVSHFEEVKNKNNKAALEWLEKSAKQNYLPALERLSQWYRRGKDGFVVEDKKKAFSLFKRAAYLGSSEAQMMLAWFYIREKEIVPETEKNITIGREWQRLAADRDHVLAQCLLAKEDKNNFEAFRWWSRAAEQGYPYACAMLGDMYLAGSGVAKDEKAAVKWFRQSAELGNEYGQYSYGLSLYHGKGI